MQSLLKDELDYRVHLYLLFQQIFLGLYRLFDHRVRIQLNNVQYSLIKLLLPLMLLIKNVCQLEKVDFWISSNFIIGSVFYSTNSNKKQYMYHSIQKTLLISFNFFAIFLKLLVFLFILKLNFFMLIYYLLINYFQVIINLFSFFSYLKLIINIIYNLSLLKL